MWEIIRAASADAAELSALAWEAKAHWGYPLDWLEQWRSQLTLTPDFVAEHLTFAARDGSMLLGFYALVEQTTEASLEHLWVRPRFHHQGVGRALFAHATATARARHLSRLTIESDPNAEPFYLKLGAVRRGVRLHKIDRQRRELPWLVFELDSA